MSISEYETYYLEEIIINTLKMVGRRHFNINSYQSDIINGNNISFLNDAENIKDFNSTHTNDFGIELNIIYFSVYENIVNIEKEISRILDTKFKTGKDVRGIIITDVSINQFKKIVNNSEYKKLINIFSFEEMYIYALDHFLNSYFVPIYKYDEVAYFEATSKNNVESFQEMNKDDASIRLLGLYAGDLVKIIRQEPTDDLIRVTYEIFKKIS